MAEFEKAEDCAKKSLKANRNNSKALTTLGDLSYKNKNYKQALTYYKKAASSDKKSYTLLVKEAQAYQKLFNNKKAQEIYTKILKSSSDVAEAYYNIALLSGSDKEKQTVYIKKALALNPLYESAWIEFARIDLEKGNYDTAQKYLSNALYIDENDFRYYYYQGLLDVNTNNFSQAKYNFKKCLKLNANYKDAQSALDNILPDEDGNMQVHI
jgi:tetratricopeptide (TPR) repeat protein